MLGLLFGVVVGGALGIISRWLIIGLISAMDYVVVDAMVKAALIAIAIVAAVYVVTWAAIGAGWWLEW